MVSNDRLILRSSLDHRPTNARSANQIKIHLTIQPNGQQAPIKSCSFESLHLIPRSPRRSIHSQRLVVRDEAARTTESAVTRQEGHSNYSLGITDDLTNLSLRPLESPWALVGVGEGSVCTQQRQYIALSPLSVWRGYVPLFSPLSATIGCPRLSLIWHRSAGLLFTPTISSNVWKGPLEPVGERVVASTKFLKSVWDPNSICWLDSFAITSKPFPTNLSSHTTALTVTGSSKVQIPPSPSEKVT